MPAIILAAALAAMPVGPSAASKPAACASTLVRDTAYGGSAQLRKLDDLPPAYLMHAVLREAGGCELAEVRFAGAWRNLQLGAAPTRTQPAGQAAPNPPR